MMTHKKGFPYDMTPQARGIFGDPEDCLEMVNRYGTYNIQPTADADHFFPAIAQGLPRRLNTAKQEANRQDAQ